MPNGIVKWFNNAKGYGFIVPEGGGDDLFAHFSAVAMEGYKTLSAGDEVQFDVTVGDKGPQATNIVTTGASNITAGAAPAAGAESENPVPRELDSSHSDSGNGG